MIILWRFKVFIKYFELLNQLLKIKQISDFQSENNYRVQSVSILKEKQIKCLV